MNSETLNRFKEFYLKSDSRDGPATELITALSEEARPAAEEFLLEALAKGDEWLAPIGLGVLRSARAAPTLKELFRRQEVGARVELALAIWRIEQWPEAIREFLRVLRSRPGPGQEPDDIVDDITWVDRVDAVWALLEVRNAEAVQALFEALDDPFDLVRSNSANALGRLYGPVPVFEEFAQALMSEDCVKRQKAREGIAALVNPATPPPSANEGYAVGFLMPTVYDYICYREGERSFVFHVNHASAGVFFRVGDYLSDMLGRPKEFLTGEKERIIPRLRKFCEDQRMVARFLDRKHDPEPERWQQKEIPIMLTGESETAVELTLLGIPVLRIRSALYPICGAILAGGAGAALGAFGSVLFDTPKWSPWAAGVGFGLVGAWLGWKLKREQEAE